MRICARTLSPRRTLRLESSFQPTSSPLCELARWPLLGVLLYVFGKQFLVLLDLVPLTRLQHRPQASCFNPGEF